MAEKEKDQGNQQTSQPEQFVRDKDGNITSAKITVQGKEKEIPLNELLELAQKGDDYTQKTQVLSEKEKRMQEEIHRQAEELAYQYLEEIEKETSQKSKSQIDESLDPTEKRMRQLENKIAELEKGSADREVTQLELRYETQLKELKGKYPDMNEEVVLAKMLATPGLDMEEVAKENHEKSTKQWDERLKKYLEEKKKQPRTEGGGPSSIPTTPAKEFTGKDLDKGDVRRAATEAIKQELQE